jgi:hypothetical protein
MERERSLDDELPDDEYVRTHGTEIKEPPYEDFSEDKTEPFDEEGDDLPTQRLTPADRWLNRRRVSP